MDARSGRFPEADAGAEGTRPQSPVKRWVIWGWPGVEFGKDVPATEFVGYENMGIAEAKVVALVVENEQAEELMPGVDAIVVLDKTPFYAEMGGQVADMAISFFPVRIPVASMSRMYRRTRAVNTCTMAKWPEGTLKLGDTGSGANWCRTPQGCYACPQRHAFAGQSAAHSSGRSCAPGRFFGGTDRLRFDFTHFSALTAEELALVEHLVNEAILEGYAVRTDVLPIEEAKKRGAIALFGEKYGDTVRVVDMGEGYSVEFCGGTHLDNTAKVGVFHIDREFSVASGVRRIEATTGKVSLEEMNATKTLMFEAAAAIKAQPAELQEKLQQMMGELRGSAPRCGEI